MNLGNHLAAARKTSGLSQEEVAAKLGVSRQTISKWELDETLPDIRQAKKLADLYHRTLDELIEFDADLEMIEDAIHSIREEKQQQLDWTAVWGKMYPVLTAYQQTVDIPRYASSLRALLADLRTRYGYSETDALLVLKDILGNCWKTS